MFQAENLVRGCTQGGRSQDGTAIRFVKVGPHTGHIAHVIAHVVGNGSRVAGIVFRDAGFHFAHQVGTYVGCLSVNTSAHAGKQSLGRCTHAKSQHGGGDDHVFLLRAGRIYKIIQNEIPERNIQQGKTNDHQTHDGPASESHLQALIEGTAGSMCGACRGISGCFHTQKAGQTREESPGQEGKRYPIVLQTEISHGGKNQGQYYKYYGDDLVLLLEIGHRSFSYKTGNFFH